MTEALQPKTPSGEPIDRKNADTPRSGGDIGQEERQRFSFRHSYGLIRIKFSRALHRNARTMLARLAIWPARLVLAALDLPIRWLMNLLDSVIGDRGYLTVGSIIGGYLLVFGLIDAKHQQDDGRASLERSLFITMVSSGNAQSFVVAMKGFGKAQSMCVTEHPNLFTPWKWGRSEQPNLWPLREWAVAQLSSCEQHTCSMDESRIDLRRANLEWAYINAKVNLSHANLDEARMTGAELSGVDLSEATLSHASLEHALLIGVNLSGAHLANANLWETGLKGANLSGADLRYANLMGADIVGADFRGANLDGVDLTGAIYDDSTKFPDGFNKLENLMLKEDPILRRLTQQFEESPFNKCGIKYNE